MIKLQTDYFGFASDGGEIKIFPFLETSDFTFPNFFKLPVSNNNSHNAQKMEVPNDISLQSWRDADI